MPNKIRKREFEVEEADMKPFMNLMVVLIPMLLLSAEFAKIAIIDLKLPENRGSQTTRAVKKAPKEDKDEKLLLTAIITDSVVTLGAKGGFLPSVFYREYHRYITKDDNIDTTVEYKPDQVVKHPITGRELEIYERYDIFLYACNEKREIQKCLYNKFGEMVTNSDFQAIKKVSPGDTVWTLSNPRRREVVQDPGEYVLKPKSAYDELKNRLMSIKDRFRDAGPSDGDDIIIAAENEVLYDKIVQIMDVSREAEYPNISIAKLRG